MTYLEVDFVFQLIRRINLGRQVRKIALIITIISCTANPCFASSTLDMSLNELTAQIVSGLSEGEKYKIALVEFANIDNKKNELGSFISEELTTRLFKTKRFSVVERQLISRVLEEQRLNLTGAIDDSTARKIGKILGVDAICTGTISDLGETLKINARLISPETGAIFAVASTEVIKDDNVMSLTHKYNAYRALEPRANAQRTHSKSTTNLVYNGDFTKRYEGWDKRIGDITQGSSKTEIISLPAAKPGKALHISHQGNGFVQFSQIVDVQYPDILFTASFQASSHEGAIIGFSGTGVSQIALQYLDENNTPLGQTVLLNYVKNPFADTPLIGVPRREGDTYKTHYVEFQNGKFNTNYRIDISKEIEDNILGVDISSLRKVAIVIWCGANHSQAGSELWVTDISMKPK